MSKPRVKEVALSVSLNKRQAQALRALALPMTPAQWSACNDDPRIIDVLFGGAETLDSQVLTPFGFKRMGDIRLGDVVACPDGTFSPVIAIRPRGIMPIYRVRCTDGAEVRVTGDHLWRASIVGYTRKRNSVPGNSDGIYTTDELRAFVTKAQRKHFGIRPWPLIPLCQPIQFTIASRNASARWPIDPYALGVLIGDGSLARATPSFASADEHIIERMQSLFPMIRHGARYNYRIPDGGTLHRHLADMDLCVRAEHKHIPERYKRAPLDIRWALMQGLMDTDGYADAAGDCSYTTVSHRLALDVQWIARSLGAKATLSQKQGAYRKADGARVECQTAYTLAINMPNPERLFSLPRKRERAAQPYNGGLGQLKRRIISIEPDGEEEAQCITIRHPDGLYITDDFIVTHNSKGPGKSWFLCVATYLYALEVSRRFALPVSSDVPHVGWIGRKVAQVFTGTTLETWKSIIPSECYSIVAGSEKHPRHIRIADRIAIDYGGLDSRTDLERFNSAEYGWIAIDQAEETTKDDVAVLMASRRKRLPDPKTKELVSLPFRGLWTANPRQCWLKEEFVDHPRDGKVFVPAIPADNPHLPNGYLQTLEDSFSHRPDLLKAYRDGDWNALSGIDQIILAEWLTAAKIRVGRDPYLKRWVSVDPARFGDDSCVILGGENTRLLDARVLPACGEPQIVSEVEAMLERMGDRTDGVRIPAIVEIVGVCGVGDYLRQHGRSVIEHLPAAAATQPDRFYNLRAEVWSTVGRWLQTGQYDNRAGGYFELPEPMTDPALRLVWQRICEQLLWPWYEFRGQKVLVAAKEDIKAMHSGTSPDYGDAYANGIYYLPRIPIQAHSARIGYERRAPARIPVLQPMGF